VHELERIALSAYLPVYGTDALVVGGATCLRAPHAPGSPMLNRVVGLGLEGPVDDAALSAALDAMGDTTFYVAVAPDADPSLDRLLASRGLGHGWGWMLFERDGRPAAAARGGLEVVEVTSASADAWAGVVLSGYGLSESSRPTVAAVPTLEGWTGFLALDGDTPVSAAAVWVAPPAAYFGFAATLADHRGKGGQGALFAARVEHARAAGCTRLVTETGELREASPSASYRNILRHGFEERHVVAHRLRSRDATS
jgi:GNAT superfamily N-acetyltransferase